MSPRRTFLAGLSAAAFASLLFGVAGAQAFEILPYEPAAAQAAIASGKPVVLHVYASWCLQCHLQKNILDELKSDPAYKNLTVYRIDYDDQKSVVNALNTPRATLISYNGRKERARMSFEISEDSVKKALQAAL